LFKDANRKKLNAETLSTVQRDLKRQIEDNMEAGEDDNEVDYRKIYKTIMCPLREECTKVKM